MIAWEGKVYHECCASETGIKYNGAKHTVKGGVKLPRSVESYAR